MNAFLLRWTVAMLALMCAPNVLADGKMFAEKVPTSIPYQRAIILHSGETQTLVLQSQYQVPGTSDTHTLGWVVPVPAVPKITSTSSDSAHVAFMHMDLRTKPRFTRVGREVLGSILWLSVGAIPVSLIGAALTLNRARKRWLVGSAVSVTIAIAIIFAPGALARKSGAGGVEVFKSQQAGIYDVKVIRAKAAADVLAWLNENSFRFGPEDEAAIQAYLDKGWVFTVAKIRPSAGRSTPSPSSEGLADPLILRFPSANPIYPLALTATGGHDTEVLIYLASDIPRTCDRRLPVRYAGNGPRAFDLCDLMTDQDEAFWSKDELSGKYPFTRLAKFKGTLTPEQMRKDLEFLPDPYPTTNYREHIYRW